MKKLAVVILVLAALSPLGIAPIYADDGLNERLRGIEIKQEKLLASLEEIKSELQIIKIRITSR